MSITVKIGEAKTRLSELLTRVEEGEEIVISRGPDPIARIIKETPDYRCEAAIDRIRALRKSFKKASLEEMLNWREEGRRY